MILQRCTHPRPCYDDGKCHYKGECGHKAPLTNADRIRAMNDEELAEFLYNYKFTDMCEEGCDLCHYHGDCENRLADWLKQPSKEDDHA